MRRQSGLVVPLFSLASRASWGIGELADLAWFCRWAEEGGQSLVQILPINEMTPGEHSPYSAMTSMALDPIYITMGEVPDFQAIGGELGFGDDDRATLARLRSSPTIPYLDVRRFKERWLRRSWDRFIRLEVSAGSPRSLQFHRFCEQEGWWLDEYALFRSLKAAHQERAWPEWPAALASADAATVRQAAESVHLDMQYRRYVQWLASLQWHEAKRKAWPTRILGDLPFMIAADSAEVWLRQPQFRFDATVGVPPDAFSDTGQDWGLPPWRWDQMAADGFSWMRARARRYAELYDGFRIDHLVGLYRTYIRPLDQSTAFFEPADEGQQTAVGEALVEIFRTGGAPDGTPFDARPHPHVFAEDLGSIPDFVRASMSRIGLPGLKVLRWERQYDVAGHPPIDPRDFPELSVATTGTHDIEPLAATDEGRDEAGRHAIIESLLGARSYLTLLPVQDVYGWPDRINTPALVDAGNWTFRLPWPVDTWLDREDTVARADWLRDLTRAADR